MSLDDPRFQLPATTTTRLDEWQRWGPPRPVPLPSRSDASNGSTTDAADLQRRATEELGRRADDARRLAEEARSLAEESIPEVDAEWIPAVDAEWIPRSTRRSGRPTSRWGSAPQQPSACWP